MVMMLLDVTDIQVQNGSEKSLSLTRGMADGKWDGTWELILPHGQSDPSFHFGNIRPTYMQNTSCCELVFSWQKHIITGHAQTQLSMLCSLVGKTWGK
jgi:hypothetical protein